MDSKYTSLLVNTLWWCCLRRSKLTCWPATGDWGYLATAKQLARRKLASQPNRHHGGALILLNDSSMHVGPNFGPKRLLKPLRLCPSAWSLQTPTVPPDRSTWGMLLLTLLVKRTVVHGCCESPWWGHIDEQGLNNSNPGWPPEGESWMQRDKSPRPYLLAFHMKHALICDANAWCL